jgi:tryptophan 2,3-dioxygenase
LSDSSPSGPRGKRGASSQGAPAESIDYPSYLSLDKLLELQHTRSAPQHPDELLFIVVHQASELWFKVILADLGELIDAMEHSDSGLALWHVQRINSLMRIVASQLASLETLPPQHFAAFRSYLGSSSGAQSVQFRALEATSNLRDPAFIKALEERGQTPDIVSHALARPTLQSLFVALVEHEGLTLDELYTGPGPGILFFLAEALLEYEQNFAEWRFKHVQLVERIIGPMTGGTGGTLGARYLSQSTNQRFFPLLWEVRGRLYQKG